MADIFGPVTTFVPGHKRRTRNKSVIEAKVYVFIFVCPTTKSINLQVIENKAVDPDGVVDGLCRLGCEVGILYHFCIDQDSALMKVMKEAQVSMRDLQYSQHEINLETCPVSGHSAHGLVERH